jgi:DNA-directed RNA polymerase specialized sigma24 family protein
MGVSADERDEAEDVRLVELRALVRRVVAARLADPATVDDLVQETLTRVLGARPASTTRPLHRTR